MALKSSFMVAGLVLCGALFRGLVGQSSRQGIQTGPRVDCKQALDEAFVLLSQSMESCRAIMLVVVIVQLTSNIPKQTRLTIFIIS